MSIELGILLPASAMGVAVGAIAIHALVETVPARFEKAVNARARDEAENPHARSIVGTTESDHLDATQVKRVCGICGDVVSEAERRKCGDCPYGVAR